MQEISNRKFQLRVRRYEQSAISTTWTEGWTDLPQTLHASDWQASWPLSATRWTNWQNDTFLALYGYVTEDVCDFPHLWGKSQRTIKRLRKIKTIPPSSRCHDLRPKWPLQFEGGCGLCDWTIVGSKSVYPSNKIFPHHNQGRTGTSVRTDRCEYHKSISRNSKSVNANTVPVIAARRRVNPSVFCTPELLKNWRDAEDPAILLRVFQSEENGNMLHRKVANYLPVDTAQTSRKV
jgi:hypothetical protein